MAVNVIEDLTSEAEDFLGLPQIQEVGIAGFKLFATVKRSTEFSSNVPVIPLEDGSNASDHIILKPAVLKIEGVVADTFALNNPVIEAYKRQQAEIGNVTKYLPRRTTTQLTKVNGFLNDLADQTRRIDAAVNDGIQIVEFYGDNSDVETLRQKFYSKMKQLHDAKQLCQIQTSYQLFQNMRITSVTMSEDNQTDDITFSISAQELKFARTLIVDVTQFFKKPSAGNKGVTQGVADKGKQAGTEVPQSSLSFLFGG